MGKKIIHTTCGSKLYTGSSCGKGKIPSMRIYAPKTSPHRICALNNLFTDRSLNSLFYFFFEYCSKCQSITVNVKQFPQSKTYSPTISKLQQSEGSAYTLGTTPGATSTERMVLYKSLCVQEAMPKNHAQGKKGQAVINVAWRRGNGKLTFFPPWTYSVAWVFLS